MAVFIFEPDAFDKLVYVEGTDIIEHQKNMGICSFWAFLKRWKEIDAECPELKNKYPNESFDVKGNGAIYGWWGWNRYIVFYSGEIMMHWYFIESSMIDTLYRAIEIGFRIFPDEIKQDIPAWQRNSKEWWRERISKKFR